MNEVIKKGSNTKVLLLSATPVNNSLTDLRNQLSIITSDQDHALEDHGISSVSTLLRKTQKELNEWLDTDKRTKGALLDRLPADFYKLLEMLTISRSRKHITGYYGNDNLGKFPQKLPPKTYNPNIDEQMKLLNFHDTNEVLEALKLAVYSPMSYIRSEFKAYYREKYQTVHGDRVLFYHESRELITAKLHRFNLFKRLESSVYSFGETIRRLIARIDSYIEVISNYNSGNFILEGEEILEEDDITLDYKYDIKVEHLLAADFLEDLYYDKNILDQLYSHVLEILEERRDNKLKQLKEIVIDKITQTPYNQGNRKLLIFSAFADTANYLYDSMSGELSQLGVNVSCVTGSNNPRSTIKGFTEFNKVLSHFSPRSKMNGDLPMEQQIDVLIGTDCISEGQNLQDCDCVVNYDIQWNPVVLIQRFGRIDRIGSINEKIAMINFFPNVALNDYLQLEQRVKGKMMATNLASTGDEDLLSPEMNDFMFRKKQLERLQEEVVDMDELNDNISLTDLNMNDYLYELAAYIKSHPEIAHVPKGIYSLVEGEKRGCIFCFRHQSDSTKPQNESSLYPYYIMYMSSKGEVHFGNINARETLKEFRKLTYGKEDPISELIKKFNKTTKNAEDMKIYSLLLSKAIQAIQGEEDKQSQASIFDFSGYNNEFANSSQDDFELISFLVVD